MPSKDTEPVGRQDDIMWFTLQAALSVYVLYPTTFDRDKKQS